jgi:uncharacterized small protein (DUF1192 family)
MFEEEAPRPHSTFTPPVLDAWGAAELRAYIETLQAEIARAEAAIKAREAQRNAADAFFRKPGQG